MSTTAWTTATTRIESAQHDGAEQLDLHGLGLKAVPKLPIAMQSLRRLDLSDNRLTELPPGLWDLVGIEHLDVGSNRLATLDPAIRRLTRLNYLDASENHLTALPSELAKCVRLRRLALFKNELTDISPAGALPALVELDVSRNRLRDLPRFQSATTLVALDASHNQIASLAPWCDGLGRLRRLDLSRNRLERVAGLTSLHLEELLLDDNLLAEPPHELAALESLSFLSASGNPFGDLPEQFDRVSRREDRGRARAAIGGHTSGGPKPAGHLKAEPYRFDFSLQSEGVTGANEVIDLYYKRFDACCSARLTFPDGSRVQLRGLSRKAALAVVEQHRPSLEPGKALLDVGSADSLSDRDSKSHLVEEAVARLPRSALVPKSGDEPTVPFHREARPTAPQEDSDSSHPPPADSAASIVVSRYVQASHPDEVEPNQVLSITVTLRRTIDGQDGTPIEMSATTNAEGQPTGAPPFMVRVHPSKAFELVGPREHELAVPAEADTPPKSFQLRARAEASGPQEINLTFHQNYEVLGQMRLIVKVVSGASDHFLTATYRRIRRPWDTAQIAPPDAVVTVNRTTYRDRDRLEYAYEWVKRQWPLKEAGAVDLRSNVANTAATKYQQLSHFAHRPAGAAPETWVRDLEKIGENLYRDIVPPDLRAFFAQFLPTAQSLLIYTNDPWIPWEIVKPWGDGLPAEDSDFLCARLALARWYYSTEGQKPAAVVAARRFAMITAAANLAAIDEERGYLEGIPASWPPIELVGPSPNTPSGIVKLLSMGDANLVHFATHGIQQSDGAGVAMLSVGGEVFSLEDLVGPKLEQGLRRAAPLVVMNACHTARSEAAFTRTEGWAERFLELGSSAFIGANWEVADELACRFACVLYDLLRQQHQIGYAVQFARDAIRQVAPANSTWLAYSLYAHPNAVVLAG